MSLINTFTRKDDFFNDAFGRLRVSDPQTRFDCEFIYDKQPLLIDEVLSGGATAAHVANTRDITLAIINTTNATSGALYSHYDIPYTAGNSHLIDVTGVLDYANIGGGTAYVFVRTKVSGTVAETTYAQNTWDNATTGVNWNYSHILMMDLQSLKIGRIRFYLVQNGLPVKLKEVYNDNVRNSGYWQRPTLPVYWRIYNDSTYTYMEMGYGDDENGIGIRYRVTANASATMKAICATVKSEGGKGILELDGYSFGISNRTTAITVANTLIPVLSIRMASTFNSLTNRGLALVRGMDIAIDNPINLRVFYRPTLTNASWVSVDSNSFMEYDVSATAITGGTLIDDIPISTSRNVPASKENQLGRTILSLGRTGTSDILTIACVRTTSTSAATYAAFHWEEIR